jgi:hypothetical protein
MASAPASNDLPAADLLTLGTKARPPNPVGMPAGMEGMTRHEARDRRCIADRRRTPGRATLVTASTSRGEPPLATPCHCGHAADDHDAIASRYCEATVVGALPRGCMCILITQPPPARSFGYYR